MQPSKTIYIVVGPTAVGKTAFAIALAQHLHTQIISADSRQCFKELAIGVAKPTDAQLSSIKHYFIHTHSIQQPMNAGVFEQYALQSAQEIFTQSNEAVMVGGTGLYIKAFAEGMDNIPPVSPQVKESITAQYEMHGLAWLQHQVATLDPTFWEIAEQQNPHRLMRALAVLQETGHSITTFQTHQSLQRPFHIQYIGLEMPREALYATINQRVTTMIADGLVEEARALYPYRHLNALQTVGYTEIFEYLQGNTTLETAIRLIQQNTRHYAKRQLTWFKRNPQIHWINVQASIAIPELLQMLGHKKSN